MKMRNNPIRDDSYQESMEFEGVSYEGIEECVEDDRYHFKKPLVIAVMAISISLIVSGVYTISDDSEIARLLQRAYMASVNSMVRQIKSICIDRSDLL